MEYKRMKLSKEDLEGDDNTDVIKELGDEMFNRLMNKDVNFGSSNVIFLVEYCQLWCHVEPLFFNENSNLMNNYRDAIYRLNKKFGDFVDWNNASFGVVMADNANQAIQKFLENSSRINPTV